MKIRTDFVTNSSSSSYVTVNVSFRDGFSAELLKFGCESDSSLLRGFEMPRIDDAGALRLGAGHIETVEQLLSYLSWIPESPQSFGSPWSLDEPVYNEDYLEADIEDFDGYTLADIKKITATAEVSASSVENDGSFYLDEPYEEGKPVGDFLIQFYADEGAYIEDNSLRFPYDEDSYSLTAEDEGTKGLLRDCISECITGEDPDLSFDSDIEDSFLEKILESGKLIYPGYADIILRDVSINTKIEIDFSNFDSSQCRTEEQRKETKYLKACTLLESGDYDAAVAAFTKLGEYKDCKQQLKETKYQKALSLQKAGDCDAAMAVFNEFGKYKDCKQHILDIKEKWYQEALSIRNEGKIEEALILYRKLGGYKDSAAQLQELYRALIKNAKVSSSVMFGSYKNKAIQWRVLAEENGKLLLITDEAIEQRAYHTKYEDITWEKCTLRSWLNGEFYNSAFSKDEKAMIQTTAVSADKNPKWSTNPGNATTDKVFLLSIQEAEKYFKTNKDRVCNYNGESCWWWLRSPGDAQDYAALVYRDGSVGYSGNDVDDDYGAVRPALWINPDS